MRLRRRKRLGIGFPWRLRLAATFVFCKRVLREIAFVVACSPLGDQQHLSSWSAFLVLPLAVRELGFLLLHNRRRRRAVCCAEDFNLWLLVVPKQAGEVLLSSEARHGLPGSSLLCDLFLLRGTQVSRGLFAGSLLLLKV